MRTTLLSLVSVILLFLTTLHAATFEASFTDENLWNGKAVPEEEVCSDYNFEAGNTPEITLKHIPKYASLQLFILLLIKIPAQTIKRNKCSPLLIIMSKR